MPLFTKIDLLQWQTAKKMFENKSYIWSLEKEVKSKSTSRKGTKIGFKYSFSIPIINNKTQAYLPLKQWVENIFIHQYDDHWIL